MRAIWLPPAFLLLILRSDIGWKIGTDSRPLFYRTRPTVFSSDLRLVISGQKCPSKASFDGYFCPIPLSFQIVCLVRPQTPTSTQWSYFSIVFTEHGLQRELQRSAASRRWVLDLVVRAASACNFKPSALITLRMVSKPGLLSPERAL